MFKVFEISETMRFEENQRKPSGVEFSAIQIFEKIKKNFKVLKIQISKIFVIFSGHVVIFVSVSDVTNYSSRLKKNHGQK